MLPVVCLFVCLLKCLSEWVSHHHRDALASHLGHHDHLEYFSTVQSSSVGRVRYELLEKMIQPCGFPPQPEEEEEEGG